MNNKINCDICGTVLNKNQNKIFERISNMDDVCFCETAIEIEKLRSELEEEKRKDDIRANALYQCQEEVKKLQKENEELKKENNKLSEDLDFVNKDMVTDYYKIKKQLSELNTNGGFKILSIMQKIRVKDNIIYDDETGVYKIEKLDSKSLGAKND